MPVKKYKDIIAESVKFTHLMSGILQKAEPLVLDCVEIGIKVFHDAIHPAPCNIEEHEHPYYELAWMERGDMTYICDNARIENTDDNCNMFFMPPFTLHSRYSKGPFSLIRAMAFSINAVNQKGERLLAELPKTIREHNYSYKFNDQMRFHLEHIMEQVKRQKPLFEENIICHMRSFIASFMQEYFGDAFVTGRTLRKSYGKIPEVNLVDDMKMFAETMMNRQMSMEALSAHFNHSGRHLNRIFRKHTGISINNYTLKRKAELASHFLLTSNMKVHEIATALGFKSDTYFSIFFKKQTGLSPNEFKRRGPEKKRKLQSQNRIELGGRSSNF